MSDDESANTLSGKQTRWSGFTRHEVNSFCVEFLSKFWGGVRSPTGILYIALTLIGVGWATLAIPAINESEISPETYGIYVIGFLVTVMLDAIITWKKSGEGNKVEETISQIFWVISLLLIIVSSILSVKSYHVDANKTKVGEWKNYSIPLLYAVLIVTIGMSVVLKGIDHEEHIRLASLDTDTAGLKNK